MLVMKGEIMCSDNNAPMGIPNVNMLKILVREKTGISVYDTRPEPGERREVHRIEIAEDGSMREYKGRESKPFKLVE